MAAPMLYPSIMCADPLNIQPVIDTLTPLSAGFHIDLMDNHLVPNLEGGVNLVNAIANYCDIPMWTHYMVTNPMQLIHNTLIRPRDIVSIHLNSNEDFSAVFHLLKQKLALAGLAISPDDDLRQAFDILGLCDHVLVMSVQPGFAGQQFLESTYERLRAVCTYKQDTHPTLRVGVDGGVSAKNIAALVAAGAQDIAVGSALFGHGNIMHNMRQMIDIIL